MPKKKMNGENDSTTKAAEKVGGNCCDLLYYWFDKLNYI